MIARLGHRDPFPECLLAGKCRHGAPHARHCSEQRNARASADKELLQLRQLITEAFQGRHHVQKREAGAAPAVSDISNHDSSTNPITAATTPAPEMSMPCCSPSVRLAHQSGGLGILAGRDLCSIAGHCWVALGAFGSATVGGAASALCGTRSLAPMLSFVEGVRGASERRVMTGITTVLTFRSANGLPGS